MMSVEAMTLDELNESNVTEYLLSGLLFGVLCAFAVLGASYFLTEKEVVNGTFFLKQLFAAMLAFVYLGYQRVLLSNVLSPETMDNLTSVCILFYTFLTLLFYRCFFTEYQPKKWVNIWFTLSMSLVGLALVLFSLGDVQQAMNLNMRVTAGASILLVMVPLVGIDWHNLKHEKLFNTLWAMKKKHPALHNGATGAPVEIFDVDNHHILAFRRQKGVNVVSVQVNLTGQNQTFNLHGKPRKLGAWEHQIQTN